MSFLSSISRSINTRSYVTSAAATKLLGRTNFTGNMNAVKSNVNTAATLQVLMPAVVGGGTGTVTSQVEARRHHWKEVLRIKSYDPKRKTDPIVLEDIEKMAERSLRAQGSEGLERRQRRYRFYVKPWMKRKRAKEVKQYRAMERAVSNLKKYVKYVNDFHPKNRE